MSSTFRSLVAPLTAALLGAGPLPALACSTCKCGDYTITLLGTEKPYAGRIRFAADTLFRSETVGSGVTEQETEERRLTLGLAYSFSENLTLTLQVPFVNKTLDSASLAAQEAEGLGDIDLGARWVLYRDGAVSGRHLAGLNAGLRLPTAEQVEDGNGQRLDIDVQPDAGATVPSVGGWYGYYRFPWFASVSANYFLYEEGHQNFRGGDVALVSALAQYGITTSVALQLGLDTRHSEKNEFSGVADPDSGGLLTMAFVGAAVRLGDDLLLHAGVQLPLIENLNGEQDEGNSLRLGIGYDF
ncbi:MAG TPA: hypothetical protein VGE51_08610 [Fontimonas sp.]